VPFTSSWHPGAVAWGIVGMYLLAAVEITSLLKKRLAHRIWKRVHALSLPLFVTATVHLLTAGTDAVNPISLVAVASVSVSVTALTIWRVAGLVGGSGTSSGRQATARSAMIRG